MREHHTHGKALLSDLLKYFKALSKAQQELMSEVVILIKLLLVMPATNAVSERSFSALKRVKTYLRATMGDDRLNHLMLLHIHKDRTDAVHMDFIKYTR